MHFSIPDTQEVKGSNGQTFMTYNIHMNGIIHCSVRYKQLLNLHEQLKKNYENVNLPPFPPKKILPLTFTQLEERRSMLEKYIQIVSLDNRIMSENLLRGFLLNAQMETQDLESREVQLDIHLMNGHEISVKVKSTDYTDSVLIALAQHQKIPKELQFHFALFAVKKDSKLGMCVVRKLQEFESPYMSLQSLSTGHRLVLRKGYWDSAYDDDLLDNQVCLNILYIQTLSDMKMEWIIASKEIQRQLVNLQTKGSKKEFMQLARTLPYYGYIHFQSCTTDYPEPNTQVFIKAGNRELNFKWKAKDGTRSISFKVTRMKVWRITSMPENQTDSSSNNPTKPELSFEYLLSKDKLQWISINSDQAILMSICLQGMVEELLMKKDGQRGRYKRPRSAGVVDRGIYSYMKRDGSSHQINSVANLSDSASSDTLAYSNQSMKSMAGSAESSKDFIENSAFEGIGDDDL